MTDDEVMDLLASAMKAAKDSGFELWAVLVDPNKESIYVSWQPYDNDNPILQDSMLSGISALCASLAYRLRGDIL